MIRRGKKIHLNNGVELLNYDDIFGTASFRIKDDTYSLYYKVNVQNIKDPKTLSLRCTCPYNLGDICRHEAAALFHVQDMLDRGHLQAEHLVYDQRHTVAKMKLIDAKTLRLLSSPELMLEAEKLANDKSVKIEFAQDETVKATAQIGNEKYTVLIRKNDERNFDTSCDYEDTEHVLCLPKLMVFVYLLNKYGNYYFDTIRNWDKEKNKLLEAYGYTLKDDLKGKFEFTYKEGKPFLRVLDSSIKRVAIAAPVPVREVAVETEDTEAEVLSEPSHRLRIVFNFNKKTFPNFTVDVVQGEAADNSHSFIGRTEKLDLAKYIQTDHLCEEDRYLITLLRKLQEPEIHKYVSRNSPFSGIWENIIHQEGDDLPDETRDLITEYMLPKLRKLFNLMQDNPFVFYLEAGKNFTTNHLKELHLGQENINPYFSVSGDGENYMVECKTKVDGIEVDLAEQNIVSPLFLYFNKTIYLWKDADVMHLVEEFLPNGNKKIKKNEWESYLHKKLFPLTREYHIDFNSSLVQEIKAGEPDIKLFLQEKGESLVFQPTFSYKGYETRKSDRNEIIVPVGDKVTIVHRNREVEDAFVEKLRNLHSNFSYHDESGTLVLKGPDVLRNNWFFLFIDAMKEMKVPVYGFEALKNFRFNTAKPTTKIFISNNTDWFDAKVDIIFGDQKVTVADVKRALSNKKKLVQ